MSASHRILCTPFHVLPSPFAFNSRSFLFLRFSRSYVTLARSLPFTSSVSGSRSALPNKQKRKEKPNSCSLSSEMDGPSAAVVEAVTERLDGLSVSGNSGESSVQFQPVQFGNQVEMQGRKAIWKSKSYGTVSGATAVDVDKTPIDKKTVELQGNQVAQALAAQKTSVDLSKFFKGNSLENFTVDNSTYAHAQIRATFYPKFENEKSDQEVRSRMIEMVSKGLATLEVSLKHSGSLFMYAGNEGGAYAKNSFGNMYASGIKSTSFSPCPLPSNFKTSFHHFLNVHVMDALE